MYFVLLLCDRVQAIGFGQYLYIYGPVSILASLSEVFETILLNQFQIFTNKISIKEYLHFRPRHGCQHVLLQFTEDWRKAIDQQNHAGALLVDLSKAFDCLYHYLLIAKITAYVCIQSAVLLLASYDTVRKHYVKTSSV